MAIPRLVFFYQWLRGKQGIECPTLSTNILSVEALDEALAQLGPNQKTYENRIARIRAQHQKPDAQALETAWFDNVEDYTGLRQFIEVLKPQAEAGQLRLQVILNQLLAHPEVAANPRETFNTLFARWLVANPNEAIAWYDEDTKEKLFSIDSGISSAISKLVTEHYLQEARILFQLIDNPAGLIPLFAEHYGNPERIAAFIVALLECKVLTQTIISSGLFHEFFLTHAGFMDDVNHPVNQLYGILSTFDIANSLAKEVRLISVMTKVEQREAEMAEQRGDVSNKRYFEPYALDGTRPSTKLTIVETHPIVFDVVPNQDTFKSLYRLFGQRFLLDLLGYYSTSPNAGVKKMLEQPFNNLSGDGVSQQELVQLLNVLAKENKEDLLCTVAELLQEQTINALVESGNFAVFHLISFNPNLLAKLDLTQVQRYITSIQPNDNPLDQLILLRTMLIQLKSRDGSEDVTTLLFDKIINVLMSNPNLDDSSLIEVLQSATSRPNCKAKLQQQGVLLTAQLNQSIESMIASAEGLTPDTFQDHQDAWRDLARKMAVLKAIAPEIVSGFPQDKYAFYVNLVKTMLTSQGDRFDLQATLTVLFPEFAKQEQLQNYPEGHVSEHERTLIEILVAIDSETIYPQIIEQLESPPISRLNWVEQQYGGNTLIDLASKQGNNGLIAYLLKENKLSQAALSQLLKIAMAENQWGIVKQLIHLTGENKPDLESISDALAAATKANQLKQLLTPEPSALQQHGYFHAKRPNIELPVEPSSLLALLAAHGEEETIRQLLKLSHELLKSLLTPTDITDYSGRIFPGMVVVDETTPLNNMTPFKQVLWAGDWNIWTMMLDSLKEAFKAGSLTKEEAEAIRGDLLQQYHEVLKQGVTYTLNGESIHGERHFNLQLLIEALNTYAREYEHWSVDEQKEHWCHIVGQLQRLLPANVAQHYCEAIKFNEDKNFHAILSRSLEVDNYSVTSNQLWFSNRLGADYAIYHCDRLFSQYAMYSAYGVTGSAQSDSAALSTLCETRTKDIKALGVKLAMPVEQWDLGENLVPGMTS